MDYDQLKALRDKYIFDYTIRNGRTKNAMKSFQRYLRGITKRKK